MSQGPLACFDEVGQVVLSRFRAAPSARLDRRPFESERAFPTHFWLG